MSEMKGREEYARYDEMTTQQLREILRRHAHDELENMPDTQELFYIMEVLQNREKSNPEKQIKSTDEAYETFVKHYAPEMAEGRPLSFPKRSAAASRWMKRVAVVAVVCVALAAAAVSTKAFAPELWEKVACWTREFFCFGDVNGETQGKTPDTDNNVELDSLREALERHGVVEKMVPTWIPEGYVCIDVSANRSPKSLRITAMYEQDGAQLLIQIRQESGTDTMQIEKNENLVEIYTVDGVDYYIFSNSESLQAAWIAGEYECMIAGKLTIEEIKKVIDSI